MLLKAKVFFVENNRVMMQSWDFCSLLPSRQLILWSFCWTKSFCFVEIRVTKLSTFIRNCRNFHYMLGTFSSYMSTFNTRGRYSTSLAKQFCNYRKLILEVIFWSVNMPAVCKCPGLNFQGQLGFFTAKAQNQTRTIGNWQVLYLSNWPKTVDYQLILGSAGEPWGRHIISLVEWTPFFKSVFRLVLAPWTASDDKSCTCSTDLHFLSTSAPSLQTVKFMKHFRPVPKGMSLAKCSCVT